MNLVNCLRSSHGIADTNGAQAGHIILSHEVAPCLQERDGKGVDSDCTKPVIAYRTSGNCGVMEQGDRTAALNTATDPNQQIIAYQCQGSNVGPMGAIRRGNGNETGGVPFVRQAGDMAVRRLTPRECERLQGFPDNWTRYGADGTEISDSARYRMLGNAVAVPVAEWIGKRLMDAN